MKSFLTTVMVCLLVLTSASPYPNSNYPLVTATTQNTVVLRGPVDSSSVSDTIQKLLQVEGNDVYLVLSTPGGSVVDGYHLVQTIDALYAKGVTVHCIADVAISMGFVIFQSCPVRYVRPASILMQHQMSFGTSGAIEHVKSYVNFVSNMARELNERQANRVNLTLNEFRNRTLSDWWVFGHQTLTDNLADQMVNLLCGHDTLDKTMSETRMTMFGPVELEFYQCPLLNKPKSVKWENNLNESQVSSLIAMFDPDKMVSDYDKISGLLVF